MRRQGFTVVELMVVLVIIGVLAVFAIPSFTDQLARRRIEGVATELSADLQFARSQAVSSRAAVQLVTLNGGTQYRVSSSAGDKIVDLPAGITVTDGVTVEYDQFRGTADAAHTLALASTHTSATMQLDVNAMGRVSLCSPGGSLRGYSTC